MSQSSPASSPPSLGGRKIVVAVTGGIACYKSASLVSRLVQAGAETRVIMTEAATRFVGPLTFQSLSGHAVLTSLWESDDRPDSQHVSLARWCDLFLIAPASANIIAKIAHGFTNDLVSLTAAALPRTPKATPVLLAPAMNAQMWENPILQKNLATLRDVLGCRTVGPESGWQACRTTGAGRMSEADAIFAAAEKLLSEK